MNTRALIRSELARRLGDTGNSIWSTAELNGFIDAAILGLYPTFYQRKVDVTEALDGPVQPAPAGARNLYYVGLRRPSATRVRPMRGWIEGDGDAMVPKLGIAGMELLWAWTEGWNAPADDNEVLTIPSEATEVVLLRAQIAALEKLLSDRVSLEKYHAINVRQGTTEEDIGMTLDALHASLRERIERAVPLPEVQR